MVVKFTQVGGKVVAEKLNIVQLKKLVDGLAIHPTATLAPVVHTSDGAPTADKLVVQKAKAEYAAEDLDNLVGDKTAATVVAVQKKVGAKKYTAIGKTSLKHKTGSEVTTEAVVKEILAINEQATVEYSLSLTRNLGNYESVKMQVSLNMPCMPHMDGINAAFSEVKEWVDETVKKIDSELKP